MIDNNLIQKINLITKIIKERYHLNDKELITYCNIKVAEEVWELSSEVLKNLKIARKEKIENLDKEELELELADVILSTLILANSLDININKAIEKKIKKIEQRWWI